MTDTQILTIVIGITFPVLGVLGAITAVLYNNSRLTDLQKNLDGRLGDLQKNLDARLTDLQKSVEKRIDLGFEHMELLLKLHEAEHHKH